MAGVTANPVAGWVTQQARNRSFQLSERTTPIKFLIREKSSRRYNDQRGGRLSERA